MKKQTNRLAIRNFAIVPDMDRFIREVTEYGNIGAIMRRILRLRPKDIFTLGWWNKSKLIRIAKKDFNVGVLLLVQTELLRIKNVRSKKILLTDKVVDLAVANRNLLLMEELVASIRNVGAAPGLMTNNLPSLMGLLKEAEIKDVFFFLPISASGYEMNPSKKEVEQYLKLLEPGKVYAVVNKKERSDKYLAKLGIYNEVLV
jgi:hypothetical protein